MFRRKKQVAGDRPFSSRSYGGRYSLSYYFNLSLIDFRGWSLAWRHVLAVLLVMVGLIFWHLGIYPAARELGGNSLAFQLSVLVWIGAIVVILVAFLATADNKRRLLVWVGLLPPETRGEQVIPPNKPKMRNITRRASYAMLGLEIGTLLWWLFIFTRNPDWQDQLATYVPAWLVLSLITYLVVLRLDEVWYFRRTKFPGITAILGGLALLIVVFRWSVIVLDLWAGP